MQSIENARQRYLDLIHRYLQGRLDRLSFRKRLTSEWAEEREAFWPVVWQATHAERCLEHESRIRGESPLTSPSDPRRFPRMLDSVYTLCIRSRKEEPFRASVEALLAAYRCPGSKAKEARLVDCGPHIAVFESPLPGGRSHRYHCTVKDIRAQLALVPEYELEGLWAIGLSPLTRDNEGAYGTYYRCKYPMRKPVILLHSFRLHSCQQLHEFKLHRGYNPGSAPQQFRVERSYGMEMEGTGRRVHCRWSAENGRRFMVEHVLMHEIGHHVQYQQRWRSCLRRRLPSRIKEQFAEDYAIRFNRMRKE